MVGPNLLNPLESFTGDEIGSADKRGERHVEQRQPMEQPAHVAMRGLPIQIEHDFAFIELVELEPKLHGRLTKVVYDRRLTCLGRDVSHAIAGKQLPCDGEHGHSFRVDRPFDEDTADAIEQILTRRLRVTAQVGQPLRMARGGDRVGR